MTTTAAPEAATTSSSLPDARLIAGIAPIKQAYILPHPSSVGDKDVQPPNKPPTKRSRGQNKHRPRPTSECGENAPFNKLCSNLVRDGHCPFGTVCKYSHDTETYLRGKPADLSGDCPTVAAAGFCRFSMTCRFASTHPKEDGLSRHNDDHHHQRPALQSTCDFGQIIDDIRKHRIGTYEKSEAYLKWLAANKAGAVDVDDSADSSVLSSESIHSRFLADIHDKLYLAPLTTVGNLPFRRLCKTFGADITCGEMALATNLLRGQFSEWALLKRHPSEDCFGVQICGGWADSMTRCAELLAARVPLDFVDVNMGCPIDIIYKRGMGSGLIDRPNRIRDIVLGMSRVLGSQIPLTVKIRTGVSEDKPIIHHLIPKLAQWGVKAVSIHGRSRQQRYTKAADWNYIATCVEAAKSHDIAVIGNGDIFCYDDLEEHFSNPHRPTALMIARGALIKPWIFTELKERRHWDISSRERLDIMKTYVQYGLEHFGSDQNGVDKTRWFLLESMSFLHRYVPVGLLEVLPARINQRPPRYYGRDDLETLMASDRSSDWIKLSEMLLGPAPKGFTFVPKHKANSTPIEDGSVADGGVDSDARPCAVAVEG